MTTDQIHTYVWTSTTGSNIVGTGDTRLLAAELERIHRKGGPGIAKLYRLAPGRNGDLEPMMIRCTEPTGTTAEILRYAYTITTRYGQPVEQFDVRVNQQPTPQQPAPQPTTQHRTDDPTPSNPLTTDDNPPTGRPTTRFRIRSTSAPRLPQVPSAASTWTFLGMSRVARRLLDRCRATPGATARRTAVIG